MQKKFAITLAEYQRLFNVIRSIDKAVNRSTAPSCLFVNTVGAFVLEESFKIKARPCMGEAFIHAGGASNNILVFADVAEVNNTIGEHDDRFHCWIETEDHVIDLTAPLYREYLTKAGGSIPIPRRMFQRRKSEMAESANHLEKAGDFFFQMDPRRTNRDIGNLKQSLGTGDLAKACLSWFVRPPKPMREAPVLMNDLGELTQVVEMNLIINERW